MSTSVQVEVGLDGLSVPHKHPLDLHTPTMTVKAGNGQSDCADLDCFAALVEARANPNRTIILAISNAGFSLFWHNLRCSLEKHGVENHAILIGTDAFACEAAASDTVPCVNGEGFLNPQSGPIAQGATRHGTIDYANMMHTKARPTLAALRRGYNVLFTDTDVVWLRNPLQELRYSRIGGPQDDGASYAADVLIQSDFDVSNDAACSSHDQCPRSAWCDLQTGRCEDEVCSGFYWLHASPPAIALLENLFERLEWQRRYMDARMGEQPAWNYVLRRTPGLRYRILSRDDYANGQAYFAAAARTRKPSSSARRWPPTIVHNNWIAGYDAKKQRFEAFGLWFERRDGVACIDVALPPRPLAARP